MRATGALIALAAASLLAVAAPSELNAQGNRTRLTLSGFPLSVTSTSPADFDAGAVTLGTTSFTVDLTTNGGGGGFSPRVTTVQVQCRLACPNSGTLPVGSLQWRRADLGTWNTLTTSFVQVESRTAAYNGTNDPWSNSMVWRYVLSWTGRPPTTTDTQFRISYRLVVTAP